MLALVIIFPLTVIVLALAKWQHPELRLVLLTAVALLIWAVRPSITSGLIGLVFLNAVAWFYGSGLATLCFQLFRPRRQKPENR